MSEKEKILNILSRHKESLLSRYPIRSIAVFGSVSRNEASQDSDVDIMIEFNDNIGIQFIDLADEIESLLQRNVDVVSKKAIKPRYFQSIKDDITYV